MADDLVIDLDTLTLGDLEEGERIAGDGFRAALEQSGSPTMAALVALVYIVRRRAEPNVTLEDIRNMPITMIGNVRVKGAGAHANPTSVGDGKIEGVSSRA